MSASHPYVTAPDRSFWSRAVALAWKPSDVIASGEFLIRKDDAVVSAGSCFASNLISYLERAGLTYLRTEETHPLFFDLEPENLGYAKFSAAYGNIYTARQQLQLQQRCLKLFVPSEERWTIGDEIVDPLRPGLRYRARSDREFDLLTAQHLRKTLQAFEQADAFVFTLGLTEAWVSQLDGTVFPACPGTVAGVFDPKRHEFKNFTVTEIAADLDEFVRLLRSVNPAVRLIVTVSPVPLVATASGGHVLSASTYSKSVLRVAAEEIAKRHDRVTYFPAYEIVTGPQAPDDFFEKDKRNVSQAGIDAVMAALLAHCEVEAPDAKLLVALPAGSWDGSSGGIASAISRLIVAQECEEAMADAQVSPVDLSAIAAPPIAVIPVEVAPADVPPRDVRLGGVPATPNASQAFGDTVELTAEHTALDAEGVTLRSECAALRSTLAEERAAWEAELERITVERDALAAGAAKWFEAVIAITPDHYPGAQARQSRNAWWRNLARRFSGGQFRLSPPLELAARARDAQKWELAVRYCRDALDLEPNNAAVWIQCGNALRASGKFAEAELAYRKARELAAANTQTRPSAGPVLPLPQKEPARP